MPIGARRSVLRTYRTFWQRTSQILLPPIARSSISATKQASVDGPQQPLPMERSSAGSKGGWNGVRGRLETARSFVTHAALILKALLNAKIKRRESFRPFAPSVLEEAVAEWFEEDDAVPLHDASIPNSRGKARAQSRCYPC